MLLQLLLLLGLAVVGLSRWIVRGPLKDDRRAQAICLAVLVGGYAVLLAAFLTWAYLVLHTGSPGD